MKKLYYLEKDLLLDVDDALISESIHHNNIYLHLRMDSDFLVGNIRNLGDLFIVDDNPYLTQKIYDCTYGGFGRYDKYYIIKICCSRRCYGDHYDELKHIYRDMKLDLIL
jgi:hypothetical protein